MTGRWRWSAELPAITGAAAESRVFLELPAVGGRWRLCCGGVILATGESSWTAQRIDCSALIPAGQGAASSPIQQVELEVGTQPVELEVEAQPNWRHQGFLGVIGHPPLGLWQEPRWRRSGPVALLTPPLLRWHQGTLTIELELDGATAAEVKVTVAQVSDGPTPGPRACTQEEGTQRWRVDWPEPPPWNPDRPCHQKIEVRVVVDGVLSDLHTIDLARACLDHEGESLLLNDAPLRVQGLLHWGYYPHLDGPQPGEHELREEIRQMKARGFNLLKACLWLPPHSFLRVCTEEGMAVWLEYPLWDQPLDRHSLDEDLHTYAAFARHDAQHPCVILRTLSCENDRIDAEAGAAVRERVRALAPNGLVNLNSAWIDHNPAPAFYDEHPYLHNAQWPAYLQRTRRVLDARPKLPLILGETMAFDALEDHQSRQAAVAMRRVQVEQLREVFPDAGYVVCAARDIPQSPLGVQDQNGTWKTPVEEWAWQRPVRPRPAPTVGGNLTLDDLRALLPPSVSVCLQLGEAERAQLLQGGDLLHLAGPRSASWRTPEHTFWSPVAGYDAVRIDAELRSLLQQGLLFEYFSGRALQAPPAGQARVLAHTVDVHDRSCAGSMQPFVLAARVGAGRLLVSSLRWDHIAAQDLHRRLVESVLLSPAADLPRLELPPPARSLFLDGPWRLRGPGVRDGEQRLNPGTMLHNGAANAVCGWVDAEADWQHPGDWSGPCWLRAEAIGDGFELHIDGTLVLRHGRPGMTWDAGRDLPASLEVSAHLLPGHRHRLHLRTKDHRGAGVLVGPLYLCDRDPQEGLLY